ncbi:hypothetical protein FOZ60_000377 [Perkinsus olseni]|uniref:Uncharacterized protein n=1 Tax=Perkinsus olseni TaxID=32597 RepID=A0A7J6P2G1_PEROL|nr:hypothetical protein FOZ60_000377 [Perkinsus olseni]
MSHDTDHLSSSEQNSNEEDAPSPVKPNGEALGPPRRRRTVKFSGSGSDAGSEGRRRNTSKKRSTTLSVRRERSSKTNRKSQSPEYVTRQEQEEAEVELEARHGRHDQQGAIPLGLSDDDDDEKEDTGSESSLSEEEASRPSTTATRRSVSSPATDGRRAYTSRGGHNRASIMAGTSTMGSRAKLQRPSLKPGSGIMTTGAALVNHHLTPARTALFGVSNALRVGVYADFNPFDYEAVNQMVTPWFSQWQDELYFVELAFNGESSSLRIQNRSLLYTEKCMGEKRLFPLTDTDSVIDSLSLNYNVESFVHWSDTHTSSLR